jgi:hypothetical protein
MSKIINFKKINSGGFDPLPEDRYTVECVEAKIDTSSTGNKLLATQFKVVGGEFANRRLWSNFSLKDSALFMLKTYLDVSGLDPDVEISEEELPDYIKGSKATVFVSQEMYKNKPQNKLKNWASIPQKEKSLFN